MELPASPTIALETPFAAAGSQRWLQLAVARTPALLDQALQCAGVIEADEQVDWRCPLQTNSFAEYRDQAALRCLGLDSLPVRPLEQFWPNRGPVWDGLAVTSRGKLLLVEAKAHIPEAASPGTRASGDSLEKITAALAEARAFYAPKATAPWHGALYQYANRLAFQYFLAVINELPTRLVFLDFYGARDVQGPETVDEWRGATRLIHALLGLPPDLRRHGIFHAYVDAMTVADAL
jgi:hypothetical protein